MNGSNVSNKRRRNVGSGLILGCLCVALSAIFFFFFDVMKGTKRAIQSENYFVYKIGKFDLESSFSSKIKNRIWLKTICSIICWYIILNDPT
jgi:hypothetical protein